MLKKILIVSLAVFTLASCSKDKDAPAYNLSAKFDGTSQSFNTGLTAEKELSGQAIMIVGAAGSATSGFSLSISGNGSAITAKTYTAANSEVVASYITSATSIFLSDDDFSVTITSITDTEVRGTFSGKIDDGATIKNVTEGAFTAKFE